MLLLLLSHFSRVQLCATPWTAAHQAPPSMGFSRQEYWSVFIGVSCVSYNVVLPCCVSFRYTTKWIICGSAGKEPACSVRDLGSIPALERSPGEGKGYPLQYSGLENSMESMGRKEWPPLNDFHFHTYLYIHFLKDSLVPPQPWGILFLCITSLEKESKDFPSSVFLSCFFRVRDAGWGCQYSKTKLTEWAQIVPPFSLILGLYIKPGAAHSTLA